MRDITNIAVTGGGGVVTCADGSEEEFRCSGTVVTIIASLATTPEKGRRMCIVTGDRLRRMCTRDNDMISHGLNGTSTTSTAPTAMNAEFTRLVRAVASKYNSALPDADLYIVALDVLRYAPAEAFNAVHPTPMSEVQLDQAIDILEQVGDYMKADNIAPKMISTEDTIRGINANNATFWGKKH